jgi:hypothetical protein
MAPNDETAKLRKDVEQAHFRIDALARENAELKRQVSVEHITGVAHGAAADYADRLQVGNSAVVAKIELLIEAIHLLLGPTVRTSTINLPSGPVTMTTDERRAWTSMPARTSPRTSPVTTRPAIDYGAKQ